MVSARTTQLWQEKRKPAMEKRLKWERGYWTEERINSEADEFLKWAKKETSLVLREFAALRGYPYEKLCEWCIQNDKMAITRDLCKCLIGCRRERLALLGEIDAMMVRATLPTYDREHLEMMKELRICQAKAQAPPITVKVISFKEPDLDDPIIDIVPEKKLIKRLEKACSQ